MSIQSNINQTISIAGVMARMSPGLTAKAEVSAKTKNLERQRDVYAEAARVSGAGEYADMFRTNTPTRKAEQSAQEALTTEQARVRNTRRNFLDYINDEPTSLGVPFGQLDPKLQKKLAATYSKSERQKVMNRKDAEKNV